MIIELRDNCDPTFLDHCEWIGVNEGYTCYPWSTTPSEYLDFAESDIGHSDKHSLINAVGNAKRAIHAHVDFLLHNCGRCLKQSSFPDKLHTLNKLGVIAPTLLTKYNRLRNVIEHEYVSPTLDEVAETIDVARLFVEATRHYTHPLPIAMMFRTKDDSQTCTIQCDWDRRQLLIMVNPAAPNSCSSCVVNADDKMELWSTWISRILRFLRDNSDPYIRCEEGI